MHSNERKTLPSPAARTGHPENLLVRKGPGSRPRVLNYGT
jgi:hypothetical protein